MRAIIYCRVSTADQAESGLGLEAQEALCRQYAATKGWDVVDVVAEDISGSVPPRKRPGFAGALTMLCGKGKARKADVLIANDLARFGRVTLALLELKAESERCKFALVILQMQIDTTTPTGTYMFTNMAAVAELERNETRRRTREAMAALKARGERLGRPVTTPPAVRARVAELRSEGLGLGTICQRLNAEGHRTSAGTEWTRSGVQRLVNGLRLDAEAAAASS